eukprot:6190709-Pleurochrysis_carterae.AAC.2
MPGCGTKVEKGQLANAHWEGTSTHARAPERVRMHSGAYSSTRSVSALGRQTFHGKMEPKWTRICARAEACVRKIGVQAEIG